MPLYIGNTAFIEQNQNNGINFNANSVTGLSLVNNMPVRPASTYFIALGTSSIQSGGAGWFDITDFDYPLANVGNCFANSRFTAPVTGIYFFAAHLYGTKTPNTNADTYTHPTFRVNGNDTLRQASAAIPHRLRSRTYYNSSYSWDTRITDIFNLVAGDFVQYRVYFSGNMTYYMSSSMFAGFLVG